MKHRALSILLILSMLLGIWMPGAVYAMDDADVSTELTEVTVEESSEELDESLTNETEDSDVFEDNLTEGTDQEPTPEENLEDIVENTVEAEILTEGIPEDIAAGNDDPLYWRESNRGNIGNSGDFSLQAPLKGASNDDFSDFEPRVVNGETIYKGIDVSVWQGTIDWESVAASGVEFVIIRAAFRGYAEAGNLASDSRFIQNVEGAKAAGLKVGAYIFSQAITVEEGREEAQYLMNMVRGYDMDLPLVLDYEYAGSGTGRLYDANLSKEEATAICNAFRDEVEKYGYESMVYANKWMLNEQLNADELGRVWLAEWRTSATYTGSYEFWQCSDSGVIPGINGLVDLDFWFEPTGASSDLPFRDVQPGQWFYENVKKSYEAGIVNGITSQEFGPDEKVTRCQMVTMLYRMEGSPAVSGDVGFTDIASDQYYRDAVLWGVQTGLIRGYSDTQFAPYDFMVREDLVLLLYRKAGSPTTNATLENFSDEDQVSVYAREAVAWAVEQGLIEGYTDHTIRPRSTTTRAEACTLLMRYQQLVA